MNLLYSLYMFVVSSLLAAPCLLAGLAEAQSMGGLRLVFQMWLHAVAGRRRIASEGLWVEVEGYI